MQPQDNNKDIWEHVLKDIAFRRARGIEQYGVPLTTQTLENPLWEAYCEALDLVVYLRTEIEKRKERPLSHGTLDNDFLR